MLTSDGHTAHNTDTSTTEPELTRTGRIKRRASKRVTNFQTFDQFGLNDKSLRTVSPPAVSNNDREFNFHVLQQRHSSSLSDSDETVSVGSSTQGGSEDTIDSTLDQSQEGREPIIKTTTGVPELDLAYEREKTRVWQLLESVKNLKISNNSKGDNNNQCNNTSAFKVFGGTMDFSGSPGRAGHNTSSKGATDKHDKPGASKTCDSNLVIPLPITSNDPVQTDPFGYITPGEGLIDADAPPLPKEAQQLYAQLAALKQREKDILDQLRKERDRKHIAEQLHKNALLEGKVKDQEMANLKLDVSKDISATVVKLQKERDQQLNKLREELREEQVEFEAKLKQERLLQEAEFRKQLSKLQHDHEIELAEVRHRHALEQTRLNMQLQTHMPQPCRPTLQPGMGMVGGIHHNLNEVHAAIQRGDTTVDPRSGINILKQAGISDKNVNIISQSLGVTPQQSGASVNINQNPIRHNVASNNPSDARVTQHVLNANTNDNVAQANNIVTGTMATQDSTASETQPMPQIFAVGATQPVNVATGASLNLSTAPPGGETPQITNEGASMLAAHNNDEISDDDGESISSRKPKKKKLTSGISAKPQDNIKSVQVWPHYNLHAAYAATPITFDNLTFAQLVAGESKTINKCKNVDEIKGRLGLLSRLSLLTEKGYPWEKLRCLYAAVVRAVEQQDISWGDDFRSLEETVLDPFDRVPKKPHESSKGNKSEVWFCKDFNKNNCTLDSPHDAIIGKNKRKVQHICAACWIKKKDKKSHAEVDVACPLKK